MREFNVSPLETALNFKKSETLTYWTQIDIVWVQIELNWKLLIFKLGMVIEPRAGCDDNTLKLQGDQSYCPPLEIKDADKLVGK